VTSSSTSAHALAERERLGLDIRDEMWEGVLHIVPPPSFEHQELLMELAVLVRSVARPLGYKTTLETGTYRSPRDWRVPDLLVARPSDVVADKVVGAPVLAAEIRSPGDETYQKLGFYAALGLGELLVVDRDTRAVRLFVNDGTSLVEQPPDVEAWVRSIALPLAFRRSDDDRLAVDVDGDVTVIP
jgi:Uma2 family endonuclease